MIKSTFIFIGCALLFFSCKKSHKTVHLTYCENLTTDTTGTGDTARIYMQNAFTPNGDGRNDVSRAVVKGIASMVFTVYDNGNNIVYTTDQLSVPDPHSLATCPAWNPGNSSGVETYYYRIQATTNSGHQIGECGELYKLSCFPSDIPKSSLHFEDQLMIDGTYSATITETIPDCP